MEAVVSMYEDRFDLSTFECQPIGERGKRKDENHHWWKKLGVMRSETVASPLHVAFIYQVSIAVKRTKELRSLTGWYVQSSAPYIFFAFIYLLPYWSSAIDFKNLHDISH